MLLNKVVNTVANGKIAHYDQFLLYQNIFKSRLLQRRQKAYVFGKLLSNQKSFEFRQLFCRLDWMTVSWRTYIVRSSSQHYTIQVRNGTS